MENYIEKEIGPIPPNWVNLEPNDFDYGKYPSNFLAARFKAADVVECFCLARSLLIDSAAMDNCVINNNFRIFRRATLLQSALMHYISAWDLSWQVYWFKYIVKPNDRIVTDEDYYDEEASACRYGKLIKGLKDRGKEEIANFLEKYHGKEALWKELRNAYNYIKHNGAYHISGLGINPTKSEIISIDGNSPHLIARRELDVNDWTRNLIQYHKEFIIYFNKVLEEVQYDDVEFEFSSGNKNTEAFTIFNNMSKYITKD